MTNSGIRAFVDRIESLEAEKRDLQSHRLGLPPHINRPGSNGEPVAELPVVRRAFDALVADGCKFPHGDPGEPRFSFCGAKRVPGRPYWAPHMATAYRGYTSTGEGMLLPRLGVGGRR